MTNEKCNDPGTACYSKGDCDTALECYQNALEVRLKKFGLEIEKLGPEHPDVANLYNNIGVIYRSKGNYN